MDVGIFRRGKLGFTGVVTMAFHGAAMSKMLLNVTRKAWVFLGWLRFKNGVAYRFFKIYLPLSTPIAIYNSK